jgi:hypothetical protein
MLIQTHKDRKMNKDWQRDEYMDLNVYMNIYDMYICTQTQTHTHTHTHTHTDKDINKALDIAIDKDK